MLLYQILAFAIHGKNIKSHTKTINLKCQLRKWNEEFELPGGSYSVWDIQDYFKYILRNMRPSNNPSIMIYVNKIENRITFKIKTENYLELLTPEMCVI